MTDSLLEDSLTSKEKEEDSRKLLEKKPTVKKKVKRLGKK